MPVNTSDVRFWVCPQGHTSVAWEAGQARCLTCGLTSENTNALIQRGRDSEKQEIIFWLRDQARKIRAAAGQEPGLPAIVLETAAQMLADQANGLGPARDG